MHPIQYKTSLLAFYLKGEISNDQNFINLKKPNTILKFIPLGTKKTSMAINQLVSVETNFKLRMGSLIKGLIIALIGLGVISKAFGTGLVFVLIGVNMIITAFETVLTIKTSADIKKVSFLIFEKKKAEQAEAQIREIISNRLNEMNNRIQADRIVEAINNK